MGASKSYALSEQLGAADFRIRPLADKFLYRELVRVNAYKCAQFQVPSSISYRDMEGIPEYKVGAADLGLPTATAPVCPQRSGSSGVSASLL